jgi:hypothetical protein
VWFQNHLEALAFLFMKRFIARGSVIERESMSDYETRIDLTRSDKIQKPR